MVGVVESEQGLAALRKIAQHDLARLNYPAANWVPGRIGPDGKPALDVLVVGAGMCGQTVGYGLLREGIRNIRIIERETHGREGPWNTTARMPILRSPKHLTGPDLGVPTLTFRAWYEAQHGAEGWQKLYKIARLDWLAYLLWVRDTVGVVERHCIETALELAEGNRTATAEILGVSRQSLYEKLNRYDMEGVTKAAS